MFGTSGLCGSECGFALVLCGFGGTSSLGCAVFVEVYVL